MRKLSCALNPGRPNQFLFTLGTLLKLIDIWDPTNAVADDEDYDKQGHLVSGGYKMRFLTRYNKTTDSCQCDISGLNAATSN